MKVTVSKALKLKKQLAGFLKMTEENIKKNNSIIKGGVRKVDIEQEIEIHKAAVEELVSLKTALYKSNMRVQKDIYRLKELKAELTMWNETPCDEGETVEFLSLRLHNLLNNSDGVPIDKKAELKYHEIADIKKRVTAEIASIQSSLEHHNHTTSMEVSDSLIGLLNGDFAV